jgi:hypothetical protein
MCLDYLGFMSLNFKVYDSNLTVEILHILINVYEKFGRNNIFFFKNSTNFF